MEIFLYFYHFLSLFLLSLSLFLSSVPLCEFALPVYISSKKLSSLQTRRNKKQNELYIPRLTKKKSRPESFANEKQDIHHN